MVIKLLVTNSFCPGRSVQHFIVLNSTILVHNSFHVFLFFFLIIDFHFKAVCKVFVWYMYSHLKVFSHGGCLQKGKYKIKSIWCLRISKTKMFRMNFYNESNFCDKKSVVIILQFLIYSIKIY